MGLTDGGEKEAQQSRKAEEKAQRRHRQGKLSGNMTLFCKVISLCSLLASMFTVLFACGFPQIQARLFRYAAAASSSRCSR